MQLFLDVGAHRGQTVRAVLDPRYAFDKIVCFEPARACWPDLERFRDPRLVVNRFGLWKESREMPLLDPGSLSASMFRRPIHSGRQELARFTRASDWFKEHISEGDSVYLKLNCEGSECDILDDLLDSGEIRKVDFMLVHFDVRKIESMAPREAQVRARLDGVQTLHYISADQVMEGPTVIGGMQEWLKRTGADKYSRLGPWSKARSQLRRFGFVVLPTKAPLAARRMIPRKLYERLKPVWNSIWRRF